MQHFSQMLMNAYLMKVTIAMPMQPVTTQLEVMNVHAMRDSVEMDSSAEVGDSLVVLLNSMGFEEYDLVCMCT